MNDKKSYITKKYNIPHYNIKNEHIKYYYTTYPELCCKYNLKAINNKIGPFEFDKAVNHMNEYYKDIKSTYYKDLVNQIQKNGNNIEKYDKNIADRIIFEYIKFRQNTYCLTLWPFVTNGISEFMEFLKKYGHIYYVKEIELNYNAALNLIYQLYSDTKRFWKINKLKEKLEYLGWKENDTKTIRVIFFENTSNEIISGSQSQLKTKMREQLLKYCNNKSLRGDDLLHINDSYYQTIEYSKIYLHDNTLKFLKKQNLERFLSDEFDISRLFFNTIKSWMIDNISLIDYDRFLFFGSLVLYVYGLRNCRDIDGLVVSSNNMITNDLVNKTAKFFYDNKTKFFFGSLGIMNTQYWKNEWDTKDVRWLNMMNVTHKDQLVFDPINHFYFNGIKIMTIKNETMRKFIRRKPQDYADMIQMINILDFKMNLPKIRNDKESYLNDVKKTLESKYHVNSNESDKLINLYSKS